MDFYVLILVTRYIKEVKFLCCNCLLLDCNWFTQG